MPCLEDVNKYQLNLYKFFQKLSDVGYGHLDNRGKRRRVDIVVESRSRRVIGNLPPIYPNGWFVLADSNEITAKQVKHVTALGTNANISSLILP